MRPTAFFRNMEHFFMKLATELANRRFNGKPAACLPKDSRPNDFEQAFALQQQVSEVYTKIADTQVVGWKCVLPTATTTMLAPLFADGIQQQTPNCQLFSSTDGLALVEPEIVSVFKSDLPVRDTPYSEDEIEAAIGSTHFALELMQSRYAEPEKVSFFESLADGLLNQGVYIGPEVPAHFSLEQMAKFTLTIDSDDDTYIDKAVTHPNNHPRVGLYWLVNELRQRGIAIKAGDKVITGSYAGIVKVPFDKKVNFKYGELGQFSVTFRAK